MKKILIVEDDNLIAELERDYLEANGYEAHIEADGRSGLQSFMKDGYDLVILDVMLPGMDGFELCRIIRREKNIPVIIITARRDDVDKIRGLGLGADDYMVKPFSPAEMVARVRAHIEIHERLEKQENVERKEEEIRIKGLRIVPASRRVFVDGKEISLVNKEYELLFFLASNPDIVFSKDKLFERIWGMDSAGDTATVTVHINRIREKTEKDSENFKYIETVWGAGYRMKTD